MKILLCAVNAKYIHTNIAVRLIRGYCREKIRSDIDIAEYTINNYAEDIVQDIFAKAPDVLAFSCCIWNIEMIKKISTVMKMIRPDIRIIFGGPEVSYNAVDIIENFAPCDIIITGEGEQSSYELYRALETGADISGVHGITYRTADGRAISTTPCPPLDMAELPFPYDDLSETENRICYYEASRGCPFRCSYCLSSVEKGVRYAPTEKVKRELKIFIDRRVKQVKFVDRTFNANNRYAVDIVRFLIENDNGETNFHFEVAAEILSDELTELLMTARKGLFQLEIGVQSTNEKTLEAISRTGAFDKISEISRRIKSSENIHIHLDLIAGLPHEDLNSFINSFNDVHSLFPHQLQLGFLKVLHGSGMEKMCSEYGIKYSPYAPYEVLYTHCLSYDDILYLKRIEEMVETYYNSGRFVHSVKYLIAHSKNAFDMYSRLAERRSSIFTENLTHNKNDTYKFLLDALDGFDDADEEILGWVLKYDYILHERPKGTPEWTHPMMNMLTKDEIYSMTVRQNTFSENFRTLADKNGKELLNITHIEKMPIDPRTLKRKETLIYVNYTERDMWGNAKSLEISL